MFDKYFENVVLVDNCTVSQALQLDRAVPISVFEGQKWEEADEELFSLGNVLEDLFEEQDQV